MLIGEPNATVHPLSKNFSKKFDFSRCGVIWINECREYTFLKLSGQGNSIPHIIADSAVYDTKILIFALLKQ
jgi:hypothetical protein